MVGRRVFVRFKEDPVNGRLINTHSIDVKIVVLPTRPTQAPLLVEHYTPYERILKPPVYQARSFWKNLPHEICNMGDFDDFKFACKSMFKEEYTQVEITQLSADIFM